MVIRIVNSNNQSHYLPLRRPDGYSASGYSITKLPLLRTHAEWVRQATHVDEATAKKEEAIRSRDCGINGLAITHNIPGVSFPISFPFDLMHLLENTISNYVLLFSGDFKGLDSGRENYVIPKAMWKEIGALKAASNSLIPSQFGRCIPNIVEDCTFFMAEVYLVWAMLIAPIVLRDRFAHPKYYDHFIKFIPIVNRLTQISTSRAERNQLRVDIVQWYGEYEK